MRGLELIRVLHVLNNLGSGGVESLLMNIYRKIDRNLIQFDFLLRSDKNGPIVDEIKNLGGRVFYTSEYPRHFLKNFKELNLFFKEHREYNIIHVHANSLMYVKPLTIAKQLGIPCRIIHSHSTAVASGLPLLNQIHRVNKARIKKMATHYFACSNAAGEWMFGDNQFEIINNGIDLSKMCFDPATRERIRAKYHLENTFVIGNVGRFSHPKNHRFIIRLFAEYSVAHPNARLMFVGEGELFDEVKALAKDLGVFEKVIFTGAVNDVANYLSAMDVFLFPSIYEGFGMALIEAQASGLPCVASNAVPRVAFLNDNCCSISLDASMDDWIKAIDENKVRVKPSDQLQKYDINRVSQTLEMFYLELVDHRKE